MKLNIILSALLLSTQAIRNTKFQSLQQQLEEQDPGNIPTMIYGGMGSKCSDGAYVNLIAKLKEGLKSHVECYETTVMTAIKAQGEAACKKIQENAQYNKVPQINLIGVSQGGLVARYILEECAVSGESGFKPSTTVRNLLTIGTPNNGFAEIPKGGCQQLSISNQNVMCKFEKNLLNGVVFKEEMQDTIAPAGYYRNLDDYEKYLAGSKFLPFLNNEKGQDSESYEKHRTKIMSLNQAMFVMFDQDQIIFPQISQIFGQASKKDEKGDRKNIPMEETDQYKNNDLGLKYLNEHSKLKLVHIDAKHTDYKNEDIEKTFLPFLKM